MKLRGITQVRILDLNIEDRDWLEAMSDIEDLGDYDTLRYNLKFRVHLIREKRMLGLQHLRQLN